MAFQDGNIYDILIGTFPVTANQINSFIANVNLNAQQEIGSLYKEFEQSFNLRSDYMVAQAVLETGYFKFLGGLPESYHNPAGLKDLSGEFSQFDTWRCGIRAHYERMHNYTNPISPQSICDHNPGNWRYETILNNGYDPATLVGISTFWQADMPAIDYAQYIVNLRDVLVLEFTEGEGVEPEPTEEEGLFVDFGSNIPILAIGLGTFASLLLINNLRKKY